MYPPPSLIWDSDDRTLSQAGAPTTAADSPGPATRALTPRLFVHCGALSNCRPSARARLRNARAVSPPPFTGSPSACRRRPRPRCAAAAAKPGLPHGLRGLGSQPAQCGLTWTKQSLFKKVLGRIWLPLPFRLGEANGNGWEKRRKPSAPPRACPRGPESWASGLRRRTLRAGVATALALPAPQAPLWPSLVARVSGVSQSCSVVCLGQSPGSTVKGNLIGGAPFVLLWVSVKWWGPGFRAVGLACPGTRPLSLTWTCSHFVTHPPCVWGVFSCCTRAQV